MTLFQEELKQSGVSEDQILSLNFEDISYEELLDYKALYRYITERLSGELATLLSGRYVEINLLPLSFAEYAEIKEKSDDTTFAEYMRWGGLLYIALLNDVSEQADTYLEGIYNTIIVKDVELRGIRQESDSNKRKVTDITLMKNIARFFAGNVGNLITVKKLPIILYRPVERSHRLQSAIMLRR